MKQDSFVLPYEAIINNSDKIVVVSMIGKTTFSTCGQKTKPLGRVFGGETESDSEILIEGLYDEPNQLVYLHLRGFYDTASLIKSYDALVQKCFLSENDEVTVDFHKIFNEVKTSYARGMLLLFHISHIVVVNHPNSSFDLSYIQMFKALEIARHKTAPHVSDLIRSISDVSSEWILHRRLCTPRVVFYFETCPRQLRNKNRQLMSIKKLEHAIEDKIYHILRKAKILINNSSNCLFAIPPNQEYVYVNTETDPNKDRLAHSIHSLLKSCQHGGTGIDVALDFAYTTHTDNCSEKRSFFKFLQVHTNHAFVKGFDDNIGRNISKAHFEMPEVDIWFKVTNKLYKYFCELRESGDNTVCGLSVLNTDTRFSEQRCLKVLPLAIARYQENLPPHYTRAYHESRLSLAMAVFANHARGPMFEKYSKQLIDECTQHFENGRQLCEYPSLTGNPCTLPKHESDKEHCSGVRYVAACDCGGLQGSRDDPYSVRNANNTFYSDLAKDCCWRLDRIDFPIFQPSTKEYRAANLFSNSISVQKTVRPEEVMSSDRLSDLSGESDLLSPSKLELSPSHQTSEINDSVLEILDDSDITKDKNLVRQPSTTEYLPGMLTLTSPPGLLPQFPSWSLVCLGPSSLYSHNIGLTETDHPGFMSSSNFLLPWDVTISAPSNKNWPSVSDGRKYNYGNIINRPPQRKIKTLSSSSSSGCIVNEITVKVFVGIEYECQRGHRFMMSSPDKILRANSGIVKESGHKVTTSDMPLYYNCPCRPNKPLVAQLMRIHVVSPKNLVFVTLNPKIQPASGAPVFVPGFSKPIKLTQSTYWVLRLPYIYAAEREHYSCPITTPLNGPYAARLLQGMWGVVDMH